MRRRSGRYVTIIRKWRTLRYHRRRAKAAMTWEWGVSLDLHTYTTSAYPSAPFAPFFPDSTTKNRPARFDAVPSASHCSFSSVTFSFTLLGRA